MYYMTSSNSPVNVRIGSHICKGRGLILLVTRSAIINNLSANYTEFYFASIFHLKYSIPFLQAAEESPLNSPVVMKI